MKFVWGLMIGFGLGTALGLLLAPQSGEDMRAQLGGQGKYSPGFSNELRTRANEAMGQGRELYNRTKEELTDRYSKAKDGQL